MSFSPIGEGINLVRDPIGLVLILYIPVHLCTVRQLVIYNERKCVFGSLAVQTPGTKLYHHTPKQTILILKCYNYNLGLFICGGRFVASREMYTSKQLDDDDALVYSWDLVAV